MKIIELAELLNKPVKEVEEMLKTQDEVVIDLRERSQSTRGGRLRIQVL